jgi:hypothetical protein
MVDVLSIGAAFSALNTSMQILKNAVELNDAVKAQSGVIDLQAKILSAQATALDIQTAHAAVVDEKRALEAKIAQFEAWEAEKERYTLQEFSLNSGKLAYRVKESVRASEPDHWICPNCYAQRKKALLQKRDGVGQRHGRFTAMECQNCDNRIVLAGSGD